MWSLDKVFPLQYSSEREIQNSPTEKKTPERN